MMTQKYQKIRELKVSKAMSRRKYWRWLPVPQIRLSGRWLENAGFSPCTVVHVEVMQGKMVITSKERKA